MYPNWAITPDHASGESCQKILEKCIHVCCQKSYNLILCFIDTDQLHELGLNPTENKARLENLAKENNIIIIWQDRNHEDELNRALGNRKIKKNSIKSHIKRSEVRKLKVINSPFVRNILKYLTDRD